MACNGLDQSRDRDSYDATVCNVPLNPADSSVVLYGFEIGIRRDGSTGTMGMLRQKLIYSHLPGKG